MSRSRSRIPDPRGKWIG